MFCGALAATLGEGALRVIGMGRSANNDYLSVAWTGAVGSGLLLTPALMLTDSLTHPDEAIRINCAEVAKMAAFGGASAAIAASILTGLRLPGAIAPLQGLLVGAIGMNLLMIAQHMRDKNDHAQQQVSILTAQQVDTMAKYLATFPPAYAEHDSAVAQNPAIEGNDNQHPLLLAPPPPAEQPTEATSSQAMVLRPSA
ncbi:MAG: hypothetical protein INR71_15235 [Terriglobus roseus]|nr:hypothetical protein [Terriglobus roseus]